MFQRKLLYSVTRPPHLNHPLLFTPTWLCSDTIPVLFGDLCCAVAFVIKTGSLLPVFLVALTYFPRIFPAFAVIFFISGFISFLLFESAYA